jgi:FkbM family methyltransferase
MGRAQWYIRVSLNALGLWNLLDQSRHFLKYVLKQPHEEDFQYFKNLDGSPGLFVDIGANCGQSALSFRIYNKSFQVLSFEPNQILETELKAVKMVLGKSFNYRMIGAGERTEKLKMYIPFVKGVPLTQEGTFDKTILTEDETTRHRIESATFSSKGTVHEYDFEIRRFDELELIPSVVKIDVQGFELPALRGMEQTLRKHLPLLMIENGPNSPEIAKYLKSFGYSPYMYDAGKNKLLPADPSDKVLNLFFLPATGT